MEIECTVCGHYEDVPQNLNRCGDCKSLHSGKTDDGRFYSCDNPAYYEVTGRYNVHPNFGCVFFAKEATNG